MVSILIIGVGEVDALAGRGRIPYKSSMGQNPSGPVVEFTTYVSIFKQSMSEIWVPYSVLSSNVARNGA